MDSIYAGFDRNIDYLNVPRLTRSEWKKVHARLAGLCAGFTSTFIVMVVFF